MDRCLLHQHWRFTSSTLTASVSIFCPPLLFMGGFQKCLNCDYCQRCIHTWAAPAASSYTQPLWNNPSHGQSGWRVLQKGGGNRAQKGKQHICDHLMISSHSSCQITDYIHYEFCEFNIKRKKEKKGGSMKEREHGDYRRRKLFFLFLNELSCGCKGQIKFEALNWQTSSDTS